VLGVRFGGLKSVRGPRGGFKTQKHSEKAKKDGRDCGKHDQQQKPKGD
jgi:hypothetical protein